MLLSQSIAQQGMLMVLKKNSQSGVTLVELVIALVIISVALVGMAAAVRSMVGRSADPAIRQQAIAIANAYMAEITQKEFTAGCSARHANRADYTEVCHYNGLSDGRARDQLGNGIAGLTGYTVAVAAVGSAELNGLAAADVLRITVTVTGPANTSFALVSYRARYQ